MKPATIVLVAGLIGCGLIPIDASGQTMERRRAVSRPSVELIPQVVTVNDDFRAGLSGWSTGFADYSPVNMYMELEAGIRPLPEELGVEGTGLFITGNNVSDDLFMFLKKRLRLFHGVVPNQPYEVFYSITFATNVGPECGGIGGAPGLSVYLKAGATPTEPEVVLDEEEDYYHMTVDKGIQSIGGPAASVAGNIANESGGCSADAPFESVTRSHRHTSLVTSNGAGELWLLVGTDSGFEGKTTLYYQEIHVLLRPVVEE